MRLVSLYRPLLEARSLQRVSWADAERQFPESTAALERDGVTPTELVQWNGTLYARTKGAGWFRWIEPSTSDHPGDSTVGTWIPTTKKNDDGTYAALGKPGARRIKNTTDQAVGNPGNEQLSYEKAEGIFRAEAERLKLIVDDQPLAQGVIMWMITAHRGNDDFVSLGQDTNDQLAVLYERNAQIGIIGPSVEATAPRVRRSLRDLAKSVR